MKLRHIVIAAGSAFLSFGALAEGSKTGADTQASSGWSSSAQHDSKHANSSTVKKAQQKLSAAGHDPGPIDGIMGAKTREALRDFQQAKGLDASGELDSRTLAELGVESGAVGATMSSGAQGSLGASPAGASEKDSVKTPSASNESKPSTSKQGSY